MRNKLKLFNGIFLILFIATFAHNPEYLTAQAELSAEALLNERIDSRITMDLKDASLRDVLKMLSVQSGLNFIASEAVADRKLTLYLDNVRLIDAMDKIFKANNLSYDLDKYTNIFLVKDWGKPSIELKTKVYLLKYVRVTNSRINQGSSSEEDSSSTSSSSTSTSTDSSSTSSSDSSSVANGLKDALNMVISEYGKIAEDPATNSIIVTDTPSKFSAIEDIINKLDVPIPQVIIEVEILDVDKSEVDKLGIKFSSSSTSGWFSYTGPNLGGTYFPFGSDTFRKAAAKTAPTPASWTMSGFGFILEFLSTRSSTKFLARPKIFVLNNETATVKLSAQEAIGSLTTTQGQGTSSSTNTSAERAETGVTLEVTPQISMATGEITMFLKPTVRETVNGLTIGSQTTKDVEERSVKSTVRVKDGETVIIGGLIRKKEPVTITKVPFFSSIPIVGLFFRHKDTTGTKDREILVFITPKIIKSATQMSAGDKLIPKILEEREYSSFTNDTKRREVISGFLKMYEAKSAVK